MTTPVSRGSGEVEQSGLCNCTDEINKALKPHNTRLSFALSLRAPHENLMITSEIIEKKRGSKPVVVFPSYCPFCGVHLAKEAHPVPPSDTEAGR